MKLKNIDCGLGVVCGGVGSGMGGVISGGVGMCVVVKCMCEVSVEMWVLVCVVLMKELVWLGVKGRW